MPPSPATHVPPQNIEAEESVLGAMLVAEPTLTRVIDEVKLNAADFYLDRHRAIFEAVHDLYAASKPVDELSVAEALTQTNKIDEAAGETLRPRAAAKGPRRRQRETLRRDRPAELAAAAAARRRPGNSGLGQRARRRTTGALRAGRETALRSRPQRAGLRLPHHRRHPPRRDRPAGEALHRRDRADRDPVGLPRHRRGDRGLPARDPD